MTKKNDSIVKGQLSFLNDGSIVEEKVNKKLPVWVFEGDVKRFDNIVATNVHEETSAVSEGRAKQNIIYRYKVQKMKLIKSAGGFELVGKLYKKA